MPRLSRQEACDNASSFGTGIRGIPGCFKNRATHRLIIDYGSEVSTHTLCEKCCERVSDDAERHGYDTNSMKLNRSTK